MKTWHIILIFVVIALIGIFLYLNSQKKKKEEETKQLALLYNAQSGLLTQANQSGVIGGLTTGVTGLLGGASGALAQNPALITLLSGLI